MGPSTMLRPEDSPQLSRNADPVLTFSMPSAPQNRACANGRSFDTHNTDAPLPAARWLKVRTLVAHTGVSTDGKMFSTTGLPLYWSALTAPKSVPVKLKAGAGDPTAGSSPTVLIGFPRKVICAMATVCQGRRGRLGSGPHVLIRGVPDVDATARLAKTESMARRVVIVGFPGVQALDVVGPHDVFSGASLLTGGGDDVAMSSVDGQPVITATGLAFLATPLPDPSEPIDTVVLPGGGGIDAARSDPELAGWIKRVTGNARRVVTVCTGAFLAAEAGLLDGRRVTTHWAFAGRLAREFPAVDGDPDPIFVRSSDTVWTAAGVTAGIDLALALVEDDHGTEVAQTVARWLGLYFPPPGGQSQFAAPVWLPRAKRTCIRDVQEAIESEPGGSYSIGELARLATMSRRPPARELTDELGE